MTERRYGDPAALRQALTDRLRLLVRQRRGAQLADLQRQFAYDRLLSRVFRTEPEAWVLKGATALLARMQGSARHTVDVDLYRRYASLGEAEAALRTAASVDLGDFFRFELSPGRRVAQGRATLRVPVTAYLGATDVARFHVDLVTGLAMTGEPDKVAALIPFEIPGIDPVPYWAYPLADHVADKVCAFLEVHPRAVGTAQPSTRYRDLADLTLIACRLWSGGGALDPPLHPRQRSPAAGPGHRPQRVGDGSSLAIVSSGCEDRLIPQRSPAPSGTEWLTPSGAPASSNGPARIRRRRVLP
jgi:hypothetical protein